MRFPLILLSLLGSLAVCQADAVRLTINGPDGKPVAGAQVHAVESSASGYSFKIENTFNLESDEAGHVTLGTKKPLSAPAVSKAGTEKGTAPFSSLSAVVTAPNMALGLVRLKAGETTIILQQGRALEGVVLDEAQKPVENVNVEVRQIAPANGEEPLLVPTFQKIKTQTDAQGHWRLEGLPSAGSVELKIAEGHPRLRSETLWVEIPEQGEAPPLFVESGATVRGRLLKPDGSPAAGIRLLGSGTAALPTTSADGAFQIANASERLFLQTLGGVPFVLTRKTIANLQAGEVRDIGDWRGVEGVRVRGTVVDAATKAPLKGVFVSTNGESYGTSDESGTFDFVAASGSSSAVVRADGYISQSKLVLPASRNGVIEAGTIALNQGYAAFGTVLDQAGRPVTAFITAKKKEVSARSEVAQSSEGALTFEGLAPGNYTVSVSERTLTAPVSFAVGPNLPAPDLKLVVENLTDAKPQTIRGRVFNGGEPVAGAKVRLVFEGFPASIAARTLVSNRDGSFSTTLALQRTVPKVAKVTRPGFVAGQGELRLENGVWRGEVALAKATDALRGRVVDSAGHPVAGAFVGLERSTELPIVANPQGEFELLGVPPTGVTLLASDGPRFGRLKVEKAEEALQIVLPDAAPVADKVALADEISASLSPAWAVVVDLSELSSERVERLLRRSKFPLNTQWKRHLESLSEREPQTLLAREAELQGIVPASLRDDLAFQVMRARAASPDAEEKAKVREWLKQREQERLDVSVASVTKTLEKGSIAARLSPAEGTKWLEYAAQLAAQFPNGPENYVLNDWGELAASISPSGPETLIQGWKMDAQFQLLLSALTYYGDHGNGEGARKTFTDLQKLASKMEQSKVPFKGSPLYSKPVEYVANKQLEVVRALAQSEPTEALKMVEQLESYQRDKALLEVAQGAVQLKQLDVARQVLGTISGDGSVRSETATQAAQIALSFDPALAETLLSQSYKMAASSLATYQSSASYAKARAANWGGGSRIVLERELSARQTKTQQDAIAPKAKNVVSPLESYVLRDLAVSMAVLSPKRAIELAELLPDSPQRDDVRREIVLTLLRSS